MGALSGAEVPGMVIFAMLGDRLRSAAIRVGPV
ncbi:hypothetical protein Psed_3949 [Pseudonocardia dioxanivorans CB1190]|jgi:hypothetical protein|uniref:Uncharacterized protein n=1 Tax=Pseudonocardia dioxanivorans (strain ATCC 55486 / DSM 44775 / JCM 13855 / CB1190) TaxID=675635 RepID=F4CPT2_PSEUX|nr:hypothetical protein Psed_3949 [Pseudonocardia dioxanivorans CB1190]